MSFYTGNFIKRIYQVSQTNGEMLHVPNIGDFSIELHIACNLKTLKCMYNVQNGASSRTPCLFCMAPPHALDVEQQLKKPSRSNEDVNFWPVVNIPLTHVHVCTLHALCRIIEKLVYLYIQLAWTLKPKHQALESIKKIEKILSEMALHGG